MGTIYIGERYSSAPRGFASNNGFEAEDADRAVRLAQNALNSRHDRLLDAAREFATELWRQSKTRRPEPEKQFVERFVADIELQAAECAVDGVLPKDGVRP